MTPVRFDHIAIALERMADAPAVLVGVLGGAPESGGVADDFNWGCWRFAGGGRVEIIEPRGANGFLHRFLADRGPGIHHVTLKVASLRAACERAEAHGHRIVGYDDSNSAWATAYLHPKQALGIVVQLAESSRVNGPGTWQAPPGPANPPPPVTVVGLRMRAHSRDRACAQWKRVLDGEIASEGDAALAFRWPGSPMRVAVEIDPSGAEGPVSIEIDSARPIAIPAGAHPALAAAFVRRA